MNDEAGAATAGLEARRNAAFARSAARLRFGRHQGAGLVVILRATAGDFEEEVRAVEERVEALERRRVDY